MDIDSFRQSHLSLVSSSPNCSGGYVWVWRRLGQCLERTEQTLGFVCGILAVFLWTAGHVTVYKLQRQHARPERMSNIRVFLAIHWFSDVLGCIGSVLAQQLTTQIIFSFSTVFVDTVCSAHYLAIPLTAKRKKLAAQRKVYTARSLPTRLIKCLFPLVTLLPLMSVAEVAPSSSLVRKETHAYFPFSQAYLPVLWVVGYILGTLAGLLYCMVQLVDICDSYFMSDYNLFIGMAYGASILADTAYAVSVWTQSQSIGFLYHSLPWTLPSSDNEYADVSSSDSEEVIWMPLKTMELPPHPVTASRIQILSESDGMSDKLDYLCDSGQFSMSETGGIFVDQELVPTNSPTIENDDEDIFFSDHKSGSYVDMDETVSFPIEDEASKIKTNKKSCWDSNETSTSSSGDDNDLEGQKVLERQISNLSAVSSEEKIAVWIQSAPNCGEEMIAHTEA